MKYSWLILAVIGVCLVLMVQTGCEEGQRAAEASEKVAQEPQRPTMASKEPAHAVEKAREPVRPKPVAVAQKPEPVVEQPKPVAVAEKLEPVVERPKPVVERPRPVAVAEKLEPVVERPRPVPVVVEPKVETVTAKAGANAPAIRFDKLVHDFGEVGPGSNNICEFGFSNVGDGVLKIIDVKTDCGCTMYTLKKRDYLPGESGALKLKYHATTQAGLATRRTVVTTNDKAKPRITLTIRAKVVAKVSFDPKRLNLLLKDESKSPPELTLTSVDGKPFSITSLTSTANALSADIDPSVKATKFVLRPRMDRTRLQRVTNGIIQISLTHPECKTLTIPFSALTRFKINPPVIIVFDAVPGKAIIRPNVTILNNYQEAFEIASMSSKEGSIRVVKQDKISTGYRLTLEITPPDSVDKKKFMDEFSVQIKDGELLKITLQGFYARIRPTTQ